MCISYYQSLKRSAWRLGGFSNSLAQKGLGSHERRERPSFDSVGLHCTICLQDRNGQSIGLSGTISFEQTGSRHFSACRGVVLGQEGEREIACIRAEECRYLAWHLVWL